MRVGPRAHHRASGGLPATPESWLPKEHNLYRPRHSPRQRTALTCVVIFFLTPALAFVLGVRPTAFENRALHGFPSIADGWAFFTGLSGWATDHLPLRKAGVEAANGISAGVFGDPPQSGQSTSEGPIGIEPRTQPGPNDTRPAGGYPPLLYGSDGWLYLGADVSNKCVPTLNAVQVVRAFQRLRAAVESSGRRFELVIAPDKSTVMPQHLPASYPGKDCARAASDQFWRNATTVLGDIDLRPSLAATAARVGHPLYDANDTHWSYEGGLTMAYALADRIAPGTTSSWAVKPREVDLWPADLPTLIGKSENRHLQTYTLAPDGVTDRSHYVASDFRTPLHLEQTAPIPAKGVIGSKAALIADSFTQFATPFLAAGFQNLNIVHAETMAQNTTANATALLADRDVIVVELAERNAVGGASPLLRDSVIDQIAAVLANNPR
jgi:alginate O-acetyltransferase complex protein AlgJ